MRIDVVSIFPEYLAPLELSLIGKARQDGLLDLNVHDLRDFTTDRHRTVDDTPYGGGAGMVMKPEPWAQALATVAAAGQAAAGEDAVGRRPSASRSSLCRRRQGSGSPRPRPMNWPEKTGWCSPADAMKASTSASWNGPPSTSPCGP